ncbi:uncharacterized protein LOC135091000 [Scylla paramamosain]|uniref:uncharacterized protein LOC135091000 n=1 Tax=Scylla paramamosain TaxID=85552 RepID=UPI003082842A
MLLALIDHKKPDARLLPSKCCSYRCVTGAIKPRRPGTLPCPSQKASGRQSAAGREREGTRGQEEESVSEAGRRRRHGEERTLLWRFGELTWRGRRMGAAHAWESSRREPRQHCSLAGVTVTSAPPISVLSSPPPPLHPSLLVPFHALHQTRTPSAATSSSVCLPCVNVFVHSSHQSALLLHVPHFSPFFNPFQYFPFTRSPLLLLPISLCLRFHQSTAFYFFSPILFHLLCIKLSLSSLIVHYVSFLFLRCCQPAWPCFPLVFCVPWFSPLTPSVTSTKLHSRYFLPIAAVLFSNLLRPGQPALHIIYQSITLLYFSTS